MNPEEGIEMMRQTVFGFKLEKSREALTAHGGLALMAEFNHGLGLRGLVERYLPRPGSNRVYSPSVFVDSLVMMLEGGGRSLEDLRELSREEALMTLVGRNQIPDADTMGDWLRRMGDPQRDQAGWKGLGQVRDELNRRILRRDGTVDYTLDVDATQVLGEKREGWFTDQGGKGERPILGVLVEAKVCLLDEFREGNVSPGAGHRRVYRQCKERVPEGRRFGFYPGATASEQTGVII